MLMQALIYSCDLSKYRSASEDANAETSAHPDGESTHESELLLHKPTLEDEIVLGLQSPYASEQHSSAAGDRPNINWPCYLQRAILSGLFYSWVDVDFGLFLKKKLEEKKENLLVSDSPEAQSTIETLCHNNHYSSRFVIKETLSLIQNYSEMPPEMSPGTCTALSPIRFRSQSTYTCIHLRVLEDAFYRCQKPDVSHRDR